MSTAPIAQGPVDVTVGRILHLTLMRKWFDMIANGEKRDEYREIKPYWTRRFADLSKGYDCIKFRNGYRSDSPAMTIRFDHLLIGRGRPEWGAPLDKDVYILRLGDMLVPPNAADKGRA